MSFLREHREVLLSALKRRDFFAGSSLEIHREPQRPDDETNYAGCHVLRDLAALFAPEISDLLIIGLYLGPDRCAVCVTILRLHYRDRLRRSPSAAAEEYCGYDGCGTNDLLQVRSLLDMSISPRLPVGARLLWRGQNALIAATSIRSG